MRLLCWLATDSPHGPQILQVGLDDSLGLILMSGHLDFSSASLDDAIFFMMVAPLSAQV
jgi:hypothetical protein